MKMFATASRFLAATLYLLACDAANWESWQDREFTQCCRDRGVPDAEKNCLYRKLPKVAQLPDFEDHADDFWACYAQKHDVLDCCRAESTVSSECEFLCSGPLIPEMPIESSDAKARCIGDTKTMLTVSYCHRKTRVPLSELTPPLECAETQVQKICDEKGEHCEEFVVCEKPQ